MPPDCPCSSFSSSVNKRFYRGIVLLLVVVVMSLFVIWGARDVPFQSVSLATFNVPVNETLTTSTDVEGAATSSSILVYQNQTGYVAYTPSGGWNNQRISFEFALCVAHLLNRTLLVPPASPHPPSLVDQSSLRTSNFSGYDLVPASELMSVWDFLDREQIEKMNPIVDMGLECHPPGQGQAECLRKQYGSVFRVCHDRRNGVWTDRLPEPDSILLHDFPIRTYPGDKPHCTTLEDEAFYKEKTLPLVRGLIDELGPVTDRVILFDDRSAFADLRFHRPHTFYVYQRLLTTHSVYAPFLLQCAEILLMEFRLLRARETYVVPFNAIHLRMKDRAKGTMRTVIESKMKLKDLSLPLFVATNVDVAKEDSENRAHVLEVLKQVLGPDAPLDRVYFSSESERVRKIIEKRYKESQRSDIWGAVDQLVSVWADDFIGSLQSTFAMFVYRQRGLWGQIGWRRTSAIEWLGARRNPPLDERDF